MKVSDLAMMPLRWQSVRSPIIRLLMIKERARSGLAFDPFSPELHDDPYPLLAQLIERDPVHWLEAARGWLVTRHADVDALFRNPRFSADRSVLARGVDAVWRRDSTIQATLGATIVGLDPPDHTRLRSLVNRAFTPSIVERMRARIEELTDELLDAAEAQGRMDVVHDLAEPLPVRVIADLLGIPPQDHVRLSHWSNDIASALDIAFSRDVIDRADQAIADMKEYFRPLIEDRHRNRNTDDLLGALVEAEIEGDKLSEDELYAFCILLFATGHETTTNLIAGGMLALLHNLDQWALLSEQPGIVGSAVEELLRFEPPVQMTSRVATSGFELQGKRIKPNDLLVLSIAAANRDPARFDEPHRLDLARKDNRHLSFGAGHHYCIGAPLARLEGEIVFTRLAHRFPRMRLIPDEPPVRRPTLVLRGLRSLPVTLS